MRGVDVKDSLDVAGVDEFLVIFLHLSTNSCIAQHYPLH